MNTRVLHTRRNPKETANPISQLLFWWTREFIWKGGHQDLELSDLYCTLKSDESERLCNRLEKCWNHELAKVKSLEYTVDEHGVKKLKEGQRMPRLMNAIIRAFWLQYVRAGFLMFFQYVVLTVLQPMFQGLIISYFAVNQNKKVTRTEALIYAGSLSVCSFMIVFTMHHAILMAVQTGMRIRIACSGLIYRKMFRLSSNALTQTTAGQIVNLLSNDVSRFDELSFFLNFLWIAPLQVAVVSMLLWYKVGVVTFIGVGGLLALTLPIHTLCAVFMRQLRGRIASLTDSRIQLMNELIAGIEVIKMYTWESPFSSIISKIRKLEINKIKISSYIRGFYLSVVVFTNRFVLFFTLVSFVSMGNTLSADVSFVMATYFEILQLGIAHFFPSALIVYGETRVSLKRLENFLLLEERPSKDQPKSALQENGVPKFKKHKKEKNEVVSCKIEMAQNTNVVPNETSVTINFNRVCANWRINQLPPTLCNLSMDIKGGELCALIGTVGSGKSSVLHVLLKELPIRAGKMNLYCTPSENNTENIAISYASQEPWLFVGTVRENILFGQPYDRARYVAVTRACALERDFHQLPHGDLSNVGEGGSSLSGGQKARVNLARAVYRQADIYLLDDPLSAVDSQVAKHLFNKCIKKYLHGKTRILVTHQLQFVKQAQKIVVLDHGSVKMQGSYDELLKTNDDFAELIDRIHISNETKKEEGNVKLKSMDSIQEKNIGSYAMSRTSITSRASSILTYDENCAASADANDEMKATGGLSISLFRKYFHKGASYFALFLLLMMFITSQVATSGNDYWISYWTNLETVRSSIKNDSTHVQEQYSFLFNSSFLSSIFTLDSNGLLPTDCAIYIYTFCIVSCIVTILIRNMSFMKVCTDASHNLHNTMFSNILRAVMQFFHRNPSGRILNRFSKDVGAMDEMLPKVMLEAIQIFLVLCGVFIMISIINPWMIIPMTILLTTFYLLRTFYLRTAQSVKRLEGIAKSPVFSHINATISGLRTIRSSGRDIEVLLQKQFDSLQDCHTSTWCLAISTSEAFGLLLDVIACCFITCVCFSFILLDNGDTLGGSVGLAISQSLVIIGSLQYGVKQSIEMAAQMTSVERILQYTNLPLEGSWESDHPPPPNWPTQGRLALKNVNMRYNSDEPPVLKNLNVTVEPGWKVGVVGRTGAGKSSLISALFRLFPDGLEGEIEIDGRDTRTLGLHELRSRISIIPQHPFLLSDTLRHNLDPFGNYDDHVLWETLKKVELNDVTLEQKVLQSGNNMSFGERQLLCLARAILRNNRILVLDEATANIDSRTDSLIQEAIRTNFAQCTVITIAHRLHTIIDSDRIIVMDNGSIVEFGTPHELLSDKPNGYFSQMVDNTGKQMADSLREQARKAALKSAMERGIDLSRRNSNETVTITEQSAL